MLLSCHPSSLETSRLKCFLKEHPVQIMIMYPHSSSHRKSFIMTHLCPWKNLSTSQFMLSWDELRRICDTNEPQQRTLGDQIANIVSISKSTNLVLLVLIAFQTSMGAPHLQYESLRSSRGVQGFVCKTAGATENHGWCASLHVLINPKVAHISHTKAKRKFQSLILQTSPLLNPTSSSHNNSNGFSDLSL